MIWSEKWVTLFDVTRNSDHKLIGIDQQNDDDEDLLRLTAEFSISSYQDDS